MSKQIEVSLTISEESIRRIVQSEIQIALKNAASKSQILEVDNEDGRVKLITTTPTKKDVVFTAPIRGQIPEVFVDFIKTGDVSELASDPDVKTKYKNVMFVQVNNIKGRTFYAAKASTNKDFVGIMKEEHWSEEQINELKQITDSGDTINAAILISGTKPELVLDVMIIQQSWSSLGRLFNSLWRKEQ